MSGEASTLQHARMMEMRMPKDTCPPIAARIDCGMPRHSFVRFVIIAVVATIVAHLLDPWAWQHLRNPEVHERDWGRALRVMGFLPLWLLLAAALWLHTDNFRRAAWLAFTPALGGLIAEVIKLLVRRERPNLHDGAYVFRPFADQLLSSKAMGVPSSHALVAFAAAWLLCRYYPRASVIWVALATGCALTRVLAGAHFVSDVVVAAAVAWLLVGMVWHRTSLSADFAPTA